MKNIPRILDLLTSLLKYKVFGLVACLVTFGTVAVKTMREPSVYNASSVLLVKTGREHAYRPELGESDDAGLYFSREREGIIQAEIRILRSRDLAARVIEAYAVYPELLSVGTKSARQLAVDRLMKGLTVEGFDKTDLIRVTLAHGDPKIAADAVNHLTELFKDRHLEIFSNSSASAFLEEELEDYRSGLAEAEEALEKFKTEHVAVSHDKHREMVLSQRQDLAKTRAETAHEIVGLGRKIVSLEQEITAIPEEIPLYSEAERLRARARDRYLELQIEEQKLLGTFTENDRRVRNVRKQLQLVEGYLEEEEERREREVVEMNPIYLELERELIITRSNLHAQIAKRTELDRQLAEIDEGLKGMSTLEKELRQLERNFAAQEKNFETYAARVEENRLSEGMDKRKIVSISVIQKAFPPSSSAGPNRKMGMMVGLFFSLVIGFGIPLLVHLLRQELSTPSEVERHLDLPVLATLDRQPATARGDRSRPRPSLIRKLLGFRVLQPRPAGSGG